MARSIPGSLIGLKWASILAIFTSQVWNLAFSFYYSLRALPRELDEVSRMYAADTAEVTSHLDPTGTDG